jgi:hypothetical protein
VPFGSRNSSGTTLDTFGFGVVLGGEGLVEYSVSEKEFKLGVRGLDSWPLMPLTMTPFSIFMGSSTWYVVRGPVLSSLLCVVSDSGVGIGSSCKLTL